MNNKSEISTLPNKEQYNIGAYNTRDVQGLPLGGRTKWSPELEQIQIAHNRILQKGFMRRDASDVLKDTLTAGAAWLTDVTCPSTSAAIMLHIAKEMVVKYQVADNDLNTAAQKAHKLLATRELFESIDNDVKKLFDARLALNDADKDKINIEKTARIMLIRNLGLASKLDEEVLEQAKKAVVSDLNLAPEELEEAQKESSFQEKIKQEATYILCNPMINSDQLNAAMRLAQDMAYRKIQDEVVSKQVSQHLHANAGTLDLKEKTLIKKGETHDFAFFGAAGSGKSTISKKYLSDEETGPEPDKIDRRDCVTLATDNYRAFTMPGTDEHENKDTKDVYTRSQDFAYMVKEYVGKELTRLSASGRRPNLICDCVRLEWPMDVLLAESPNLVSKVAAYRGSPGFVGIAERADSRAKDETAAPADKGRFVHTTDLLKGHVDASKFLLSNIPPNSQTEILDTDVVKGKEDPRRIAMIDSKHNIVEITNLRVMSEFMNKQSINTAAAHPVELILKGQESREATEAEMEIDAEGNLIPQKIIIPSEMRTNPINKANAVLSLVTPEYSVILKDEKGNAYAEFKCLTKLETREGKDGKPEDVLVKDGVYLNVLDIEVYKSKLLSAPSSEDIKNISKLKHPPKNEDYKALSSPESQVLAEMTRIAVQPTRIADLQKRQAEALVEYEKKEKERDALIKQMEADGLKPDVPKTQMTPESELRAQTHAAQLLLLKIKDIEKLQEYKILKSDVNTRSNLRQSIKKQEHREEQREKNDASEHQADHELARVLTTRIISKAIDSPKIITGNYSAILNCFNDILTNTVAIAPDGKKPNESPVFLIIEPMWLEQVDPIYNSEPWGQGIDAFPPAVRQFAIDNVKPTPVMGEKLTWGQVRDLRAKMVEKLENAEGLTVVKGEIENVEEYTPPVSHGIKIENFKPTKALTINFKSRNPSTEPLTISIPFTGRPVVLDLSQRVGLVPPSSSALAIDPTTLYRDPPARVEQTKNVPIFIAGPGAQAAWLMDKMGSDRQYTLIYRNTIDFRMANAILGEKKYGPDTMNVPVNGNPDLIAALEKLSKGGTIRYTKDNDDTIDINLTAYQSDDQSKKIFPAEDLFRLKPEQANRYLRALGVREKAVNNIMESFATKMEQLSDLKVDMKRVAVKLNVGDPAEIDVGYTANCTGWRSLNDFDPKDEPPFSRNQKAKEVPIFIAGPGDQAELLIDKMGTDRPYTLIYRKTIDFRMANAILGEQKYTADTMLVSVDPTDERADQDLIAELNRLSTEGITNKITYTKDNGEPIDLKITFEQADNQNKKIFSVNDTLEPEIERKLLKVLDSYDAQKKQLSGLKVDMDRVVFKLNEDPVSIEVGYVANGTAEQALNDPDFKEKPPFWGTAAKVITGEQLTQKIKLVSTAAIPPASGIHRMLAMKSQLQEMKGEAPSYDIRALAFTEEQFNTMCKECGFSEGFKKSLAGDIKKLINPNTAGNPVEWIAGKHEQWLNKNQQELGGSQNAPAVTIVPIQLAIKSAIDRTTNTLQENVDKNNNAEPGMRMQ